MTVAITSLLLVLSLRASADEAAALEARGDDAGAYRAATAWARAHPGDPLARLEAGRLALKVGDHIDAAAMWLDPVTALVPENPRAHYLWALVEDARGRPGEARRAYETALTLRPTYDDATLRAAGAAAREGDVARAIGLYRSYLVRHPKAAGVRLALGRLTGEADKALVRPERGTRKMRPLKPSGR